ncbi:glycoside hydrolase family 36 N-terminal domain-containing protein [Microbispora sp. NPDC046973]|uniref:glycoside hydrolase family 36 N-terminal domain-containing protein n=1 Tax=Microbispora sp. NPDC046973 TaxID=3155022 RepID=UPI0034007D36
MIALSADGVGVVLELAGPRPPRVLYWGVCPGPLTGLPPVPGQDVMPSQGDGWFGRPVLSGRHDSGWRPPRFTLAEAVTVNGGRVEALAKDLDCGLDLTTEIELTPQGVLRMRHTLSDTATSPYTLDRLACLMPLPAQAGEVLDFAGRWARERSPELVPSLAEQRLDFTSTLRSMLTTLVIGNLRYPRSDASPPSTSGQRPAG